MDKSSLEVAEVVGSMYEAAFEPDLWPSVLTRACGLLGARTSNLVSHDLRDLRMSFGADHGLPEDWREDYDGHYIKTDIWLEGIAARPAGLVHLSHEAVPAEALARSEFYNDFLRRQEIFHGIGGFVTRSRDRAVLIGFHRPLEAEPFAEDERRMLGFLFRHVGRAVALQGDLARIDTLRGSGWSALDSLPRGAIAVDEAARVLACNALAERILLAGGGLSVRGGRLTASTSAETARLRALVRSAAATGVGDGLGAGGAMTLTRSETKPPLHILVSPAPVERVPCAIGPEARTARALVFVSDPEGRPAPKEELLSAFYGLTPIEAKLAALVGAGIDLAEAAERLGMAKETARHHLKRIFSKTGVNRQAELVRLVSVDVL